MQLSFKEHFQLIAFQKLKDWKLEKSCMKDHTCLLDHHQRSHWDTITIGPKGMINRVLQLNNSQLESSFNSLLEKHLVLNFPNQPNPNPIQSVIDRGNLRTQMRALLTIWYDRKQEVHQVRSWSLLYPELLHQKRPTARSQVRKERRWSRIPHCKSTPKEVQETRIVEHSRSIYPWYMVSDSRDGQTGERRPHPHCHRRRTQRISWQLVDTFEFCGFRHDAHKASPWLQTSVVNLASPQESRGWSLLPKLVAKLFLIITTTMDLTLIERGNLRKSVNRLCGMSLTMNLVQNYSDQFGNS